jgi:hypothetical protein
MHARKKMVETKEHKGVGVTKSGNAGSNTYAGKGFDEHRKHKRFQVPGGVFVGFGPRANKVGQMVDVSMGGLAYRYVGCEDSCDASHLDIFVTDNDFYLGAVPFRTVCDYQVVDRVTTGPMTMRRCGVQFRKLSRKQNAQLENFIRQHTLGEA